MSEPTKLFDLARLTELTELANLCLVQIKANQLGDDHNVSVSNQITGFATAVKQDQLKSVVDQLKTLSELANLCLTEIKTNQLPDDHNVSVSNQITGFATAVKQDQLKSVVDQLKTLSELANLCLTEIKGNQLPDGHNVSVSNQITGFATAANQNQINTALTDIKTALAALTDKQAPPSALPTTQVSVDDQGAALIAARAGRIGFTVRTLSTAAGIVWIGPQGVAPGSGFPLEPGVPHDMRADAGLEYHAIADTGVTVTVYVMEAVQ